MIFGVRKTFGPAEEMSTKTLLRTAIVLAATGGFCFVVSVAASADVVTPRSAYQPASTNLLEKAPAERQMPPMKAAAHEVEAAKPADPEPTPASEQVVRPAVAQRASSGDRHSVVYGFTHPFRAGLDHMTASFGRAVGACEVGFGTGTGGPVLVLAVLGVAIPFIRRRVIGTRWSADEDVPELLYAWELTPPG